MLIVLAFFPSCQFSTIVKRYPVDTPFVFNTRIKLEAAGIPKDERVALEEGLEQQLDDSIKPRNVDKLFWSVVKSPAILDSTGINNTLLSMKYFLNSMGYFNDSISYSTHIRKNGDQQRATIDFEVMPGKVTTIDPLSYSMLNDSSQALVDHNLEKAYIKKGEPFAQNAISSELDRIVELHKNNGYLRFRRSLLYGLWDTLDVSLLAPSSDLFEQSKQLALINSRKNTPTASLDIRMKPINDSTIDSTAIQKYYVGNITVYPNINSDTADQHISRTRLGNVTIVQSGNKYKPRIFPEYIYLDKGDLYKQQRFTRTINRFNSLNTWRMINIDTLVRPGEDTVDFTIRLLPAKKYSFTTNVEGSFSQSVISGNFVGVGFNVGLQNRNFMHGANTANTNIRYGVEFGNFKAGNIIQTQQVGISNTITSPRLLLPGLTNFKTNFRGNSESVFTLNAANTERRFLFNLTSINTSWGYNFTWRGTDYATRNRTFGFGLKIPNIEYSHLLRRDSLLKLIQQNPSINNLFSDGLIASIVGNFSIVWNDKSIGNLNVFRTNFESSGLLTGLIKNSFIDEQLYRFVKLDMEYAKLYKFDKTSLVLRGFGGVGYELNSTKNPDKRYQLPFFKQYYSGGPNSMRAWQLRQLGPGSAIKAFEGELSIPDRFGDVQLEGNIEYRMPLFTVSGIPINGAIFTDVGNVWFLKKEAGSPEETFQLKRLGTDLAIGSGAGVRVDLGFFVIRLDYAYKVKDPSPRPENAQYQNKFFSYPFFKGSQLQIGIGYPFIF